MQQFFTFQYAYSTYTTFRFSELSFKNSIYFSKNFQTPLLLLTRWPQFKTLLFDLEPTHLPGLSWAQPTGGLFIKKYGKSWWTDKTNDIPRSGQVQQKLTLPSQLLPPSNEGRGGGDIIYAEKHELQERLWNMFLEMINIQTRPIHLELF